MRRLRRKDLSVRAQAMLDGRAKKVREALDPAAEARRLWQDKRAESWTEIRATLRMMASGIERCMYCEDSTGTDIDHFYPRSDYPEYAFDWTNYLRVDQRDADAAKVLDKIRQLPFSGVFVALVRLAKSHDAHSHLPLTSSRDHRTPT